MVDYARAAATSLRLLTAFGQSVTLRTLGAGTYDVNTSTVTAASETTQTRKAVILPIDRINTGQRMRDGSFTQLGDARCLMDAAGVAPVVGDKVTVGLVTWPILNVEELSPAGTPVLYDLVLRK